MYRVAATGVKFEVQLNISVSILAPLDSETFYVRFSPFRYSCLFTIGISKNLGIFSAELLETKNCWGL